MHTITPQALHALAVRDCDAFVQQVTAADLDRPTPCAGWALRDLLAHLIVQDHGFAAAAEGRGADPEVWHVGPPPQDLQFHVDLVAAHAEAVERVLAAYAAEDVLDRLVDLPEISTERQFTGAQAIGFHTVDHVVHAWDVARSLGLTYPLPDELAPTALRLARAVPVGAARLRPGAAFAPELPAPPDADPLAEVLSRLGRSPAWAPPIG